MLTLVFILCRFHCSGLDSPIERKVRKLDPNAYADNEAKMCDDIFLQVSLSLNTKTEFFGLPCFNRLKSKS